MKTVFILIGPKGSGKTYLGRLIEKELGIKFFLTESILLKIRNGRAISDKTLFKDTYATLQQKLEQFLVKSNQAAFEATGTFPYFKELLGDLQSKYHVKKIHLLAPFELCLERVHKRMSKDHFTASDALVKDTYLKNDALDYGYDLQINTAKITDYEMIQMVKSIL